MVRLAAALLVSSVAGCVPPDPPEGSNELPSAAAQRSSRAMRAAAHGRSGAPLEDEDKSGAGPASASAQAAQGPLESAPSRPSSAAARTPEPERRAPIATVFRDSFDREALGPSWRTDSRAWKIDAGRLCARGARNHPVWLSATLPVNARIEFEAMSGSDDGDLKAEAWGDGTSAATGASYTNATSYVFIYGGWHNKFHVLARLDEHAPDRAQVEVGGAELRARPVEKDRSYHFKIERSDGKTVRWLVDDIEILSLVDPAPLAGAGHEHFGFNDWDVPVCFDDLVITPL